MSAVATPPGITEAAYQQLSDEEKRRLGYQRPLSDQEFAQLTPEQLQNLGFAPKQQGAPADFGGTVYPNPDNIKPFSDTDEPDPTRLPTGVSFQHQNSTGQMPANITNPPTSEITTPARTVGASFGSDVPPLPAGYHLDQSTSDVPPLPAGYHLDQSTSDVPPLPAGYRLLDSKPPQTQTGWLDKEIPLTSYGAATEQGIQSIAQGFRDTAKGMWDTLGAPPKDKAEAAMFALGGPTLLPVYRTLVGAGHSVQEATQIASAVHDINNSSDPAGTYAKVLQQTAGQGAAQALTALATEGVIKVAPKVPAAVADIPGTAKAALRPLGDAATAVGQTLDPDVVGVVSPRVAHALRLAQKVGKVASKYGAETTGVEPPPAVTVEPPPAVTPAQLPEGFSPAVKPPVGSVSNPLQRAEATVEPSPQAAPTPEPKKLGDLLNDALGGKPLEPNVPLRNQAAAKPTATASSELPEGFKPVNSSAIQGYKYDPDTQHFEVITNTGGRYGKMGITPDQVGAFEGANSKGRAWGVLKNSPGAISTKNGLPRAVPISARSATPEDLAPGEEEQPEAKPQAKPAAASGDQDLTSILQKSLKQAIAKKPPQGAALPEPGPGGVMTTADPGMLTRRWGTSEKAIADTDAQIRGKSSEESQAYINQLADAYKNGRPVEPVLETRDADNNITSVDGRHRALAAQKAGIQRIPILIRRLPAAR